MATVFGIRKKRDHDEWLMFQPGGRLDHWTKSYERCLFKTAEDAIKRRRIENAEKIADVVEIDEKTWEEVRIVA